MEKGWGSMNIKNKKVIYVIAYILVFVFLGIFLISNRDTIGRNLSGEGDKIRKTTIVKNYRFRHKITFNKTKEITLEGDIFGLKTYTKKTDNDIVEEFYQDGNNLYKKENNTYTKYNGKIIDVDLKLLDLEYLTKLIDSSKEESRKDNVIVLYNPIDEVKLTLVSDMNKDLDTITIEKNNYSILTKIYDSNEVKDFNLLED